MFIYKDAVGFIGNVGVWSDGEGGYILVDLLTDNRLYIHWMKPAPEVTKARR